MRDFLQDPAWRGEDLGAAIPESDHAVSVALPSWRDVIGYEEKDPRVRGQLRSGYPRFLVHPAVQELAERMAPGRPCLPFSSRSAAEACAEFLVRRKGHPAQLVQRDGVHGVATSSEGANDLRAFWQHAGLVVSSRQARAVLAGRAAPDDADAAERALRERLADWYDGSAEDVFLHPSGMASIYAAFRALRTLRPDLPTVQMGFPYVDTLKMQQVLGNGVFFHAGVCGESLRDLEAALERQRYAACFCEIPGNPMLGCPDLPVLSRLLRKHGIPLVVDDTIATPFNVDVSPYADLVATSLTKFISGSGDVMGGALVCNPRSPFREPILEVLRAADSDRLWPEEVARIAELAASFPARMQCHNEGGLFLAERLRAHPAIERVWYPKWEDAEAYDKLRRQGAGWGGLISFLPRNAAEWAPRIYDELPISKGPSLGTEFSLACPFTLLAHYDELDWAESCGVSRYMIRISVGLESPADLWARIRPALDRRTAEGGT